MTTREKATVSMAAIGWALAICIPMMAWQWGLQQRVTKIEVKQENTEVIVKEDHEETIKIFLRIDDKLDRIQDKVNDVNVKIENKQDK